MAPHSPPLGWSRLNITLHWLIVVLIIAQYFESSAMTTLWDATIEGKTITERATTFGWMHIIFGVTILVAAAIRLADRLLRGRPAPAEPDPRWAVRLAHVTHFLIYTVLLVMPLLGLSAWLTGIDRLANLHTLLFTPLMILVGLHICGALAQHFVFKTDALHRMAPVVPPPGG